MFVYMYIILVQHLKSNKKLNINKRNQLAVVKLKIQLYFELYIVQFPVYCILYYNRYQHGTNCTGRRGRGGGKAASVSCPPGSLYLLCYAPGHCSRKDPLNHPRTQG